jgi:hypothetical protein
MEPHLVDLPSTQREPIAALRFLRSPLSFEFLHSLGLHPRFSWYAVQIKHSRLCDTGVGDVDLLCGQLEWTDPALHQKLVADNAKRDPHAPPYLWDELAAIELVNSGGIKWPPALDYLVGVEAKCAYLDPEADSDRAVKSGKSSRSKVRHTRNQLQALLELGLNRVVLLDLIANPPSGGIDGLAWLNASDAAQRSKGALSNALVARLAESSPCGHWVMSMGSVVGGNENFRGAGLPEKLRDAVENPLLREEATRAQRNELETRLHRVLEKLPYPQWFPPTYVDCTRCKTIHSLDPELEFCD